jgi:signal peptidase I
MPMKTPRPWLAALLGLFDAPAGLLYAGRGLAFLLCWFTLLVVYTISAVVIATGRIQQAGLVAIVCSLLVLRLSFPVLSYYSAVRSRKEETKRWFQRWYVILGAIVFGAVMNESYVRLVRSRILESFFVPGRAMAPTILHADRIFVDKSFGSAARLRQGDLVVFRSAPNGPLFVMRIVGLPGDTVELSESTLRLNGEIVKEDYASYLPSSVDMPSMPETLVPARHFFVLGDNRNFANDSRMLGPIPFESYYGRPTNVFWSRDYHATEEEPGIPTYKVGRVLWRRLGLNLTH